MTAEEKEWALSRGELGVFLKDGKDIPGMRKELEKSMVEKGKKKKKTGS